ncbi:hypothetical protein Hanom_Chr08g00737301 [Helianthus anomalus]
MCLISMTQLHVLESRQEHRTNSKFVIPVWIMSPTIRRGGRGKGPITTHNDHEARPSNMRSYRNLFGPNSENDPGNPQASYIPLQRSTSHRGFSDPTPYFKGRFNPADYIQEPSGLSH